MGKLRWGHDNNNKGLEGGMMKKTGWEELEDRTLGDITVNGSPFQLMWVAIACFVLAIMYSAMNAYYWAKFRMRRK